MDIAIILTYRCNSRCSMCNIWKNPTLPDQEISLETLARLPNHLGAINLTGGEPALRSDLPQIVDLLYPKVRKLEISSNGLFPEKLEPIIRKYPNIRIRFSLEGNEKTNNSIRGEKNGYRTKVAGLARLKQSGGKDLGFAAVIQDENVADLVGLYRFAHEGGYQLSTSTLHNGFQFHKNDNVPYDRLRIARHMEQFIEEQLKSNDVKTWFRAYITLGLEARILGSQRLLPCRHGHECVFIDPWGDVYACNVRPDLHMGNLMNQSWNEILTGPTAQRVLNEVDACQQNCWMAGVAKSSMRSRYFKKLPRLEPFIWVLRNKIRLLLGRPIDFGKWLDYSAAGQYAPGQPRVSYLNESYKRKIQTKEDIHYSQPGGYENH